MNTSTYKSIFFLLLTLTLASCANKGTDSTSTTAGKPAAAKPVELFDKGNTLYTLTNLHPDPIKYQLYSSNFLMPGLIPRCTAVKVVGLSKKRFQFTVKDVAYKYDFNPRSNPEGFDANLKQYFGKSCSSADVTKLSATDQKGIREGKPYVGMSKQGLIYAIGYPPVSPMTPDRSAPVWKYFNNRFNTMNVEFKGNTVSKIVN